MRMQQSVLGAVGLLGVLAAAAHPGPVDSYGCHPNVAHGTYHCHAGPLADRQYPSKVHMIRAYKEKQQNERPKPKVPAPGY